MPVRLGVNTSWPAFRSGPRTSRKPCAPPHAPCTRIKLAIFSGPIPARVISANRAGDATANGARPALGRSRASVRVEHGLAHLTPRFERPGVGPPGVPGQPVDRRVCDRAPQAVIADDGGDPTGDFLAAA